MHDTSNFSNNCLQTDYFTYNSCGWSHAPGGVAVTYTPFLASKLPAGSTGSHTSTEVAGPLLIPGIVPVVGVLRLEPRVGEGVLLRILPLWPLGHQAARYGAHRSPSLRTSELSASPGLHHLPDYLPYIYVTPFGSFPRP